MTTLAADSPMVQVLGKENAIGIIAADIVYEGAMVGDNAAGYGRPLSAGDKFLGHNMFKVDNTTGAAGAKNLTLKTGRYRHVVDLVGVITDVGQPVYASDDAVVTFSAAGNSYVGVITRYVSATQMEVEFRPGEEDEWGNRTRVAKTDDYTTLITDAGKVIYLGVDTKTITLLATVAGSRFTIVNPAAFGTVEIHVDPNAADLFLGGCEVAANADGDKMSNTKATQQRNDFIDVISDGATGYTVLGIRGTWAAE